jgi:Domain of unknown function (DUF4194)
MNAPPSDSALSRVLIQLLKGVAYQEDDALLWQSLLNLQSRVRDHVAGLGLELIVDEAEGYAYLRHRPAGEGVDELPRLVPRRQLSYPVSLLLVLLRKKLADFDANSGETRLVMSREQIAELLRVFLPDTANEARFMDRLDTQLNKIAEFGFVRKLRGKEAQFEVRRILKSFVDAQWLSDFEARLSAYRAHTQALDTDDREASG